MRSADDSAKRLFILYVVSYPKISCILASNIF